MPCSMNFSVYFSVLINSLLAVCMPEYMNLPLSILSKLFPCLPCKLYKQHFHDYRSLPETRSCYQPISRQAAEIGQKLIEHAVPGSVQTSHFAFNQACLWKVVVNRYNQLLSSATVCRSTGQSAKGANSYGAMAAQRI